MRTEPIVVRQFDEPVVSAARSVGLGGTLIYCQSGGLAIDGDTGLLRGDVMEVDLQAPATIFMHGQFEVNFGSMSPAEGFVHTYSHLDPLPGPVGYNFAGPTVNNLIHFYAENTYATGSYSWTGVMSREPGIITMQPLVSYSGNGVDIDPSMIYGSCFISVIISASTGSDCLEWAPPA
jgi:hypothetical protein